MDSFVIEAIDKLPNLTHEQLHNQKLFFTTEKRGNCRIEEAEDHFGISYCDLVCLVDCSGYVSAIDLELTKRLVTPH